jgi:hypothetical protein
VKLARFARDGRVFAGVVDDGIVGTVGEGASAIADAIGDLEGAQRIATTSAPIAEVEIEAVGTLRNRVAEAG